MDSRKIKELANEIKEFIIKNEMDSDIRIYFNGRCYDCNSDGKWQILEDMKASEYFDYANDDTLSMSFEGPLYTIFADPSIGKDIVNRFDKIFEKYNCYYEFGNQWNLSVYEE